MTSFLTATRIGVLSALAMTVTALAQQPQPLSPAPSRPAPPVASGDEPVPLYTVEVVRRYPHDAKAFTQGLLWHHGALYESTGREGQSEIRRVSLNDGRVMARQAIPRDKFGEGLTLWNTTLISLTWHGGVAYRWDAASLRAKGSSRYAGEGWGLAIAPEGLMLSDGSSTIRVLDPETFTERRRFRVTVRGRALTQLNELEMVDGELFANVWRTNYVVAIDPGTGVVTKVIDASALTAEVAARDGDAVLNGIAWDAKDRRLFLTGKLWPTLFEVRIAPAAVQ